MSRFSIYFNIYSLIQTWGPTFHRIGLPLAIYTVWSSPTRLAAEDYFNTIMDALASFTAISAFLEVVWSLTYVASLYLYYQVAYAYKVPFLDIMKLILEIVPPKVLYETVPLYTALEWIRKYE